MNKNFADLTLMEKRFLFIQDMHYEYDCFESKGIIL